MAKASCVEYPVGHRFVTVRTPCVDLFDDHCCAALISFFEWKTNAKIGLYDQGEPERASQPPWIKASIPQIFEETARLYSLRSLTDRIEFLRVHEIIEIADAGVGTVRKYLFNYAKVSALIRSGASIPYAPISKIADEQNDESISKIAAGFADGPSAKLPMVYKEVDLRHENIETQTPYSPPSATSEDFKHRWNRHAGFKKLTGSEMKYAEERFQSIQISEPDLEAALNGFYADEDARRDKYPSRRFLSRPHSFILQAPPSPERTNGTSKQYESVPPKPPAPAAPLSAGQNIDFMTRWNLTVVSGPQVSILSSQERRRLSCLSTEDPDLPANYESILARVEATWSGMHPDWKDSKPETWFNFRGVVLKGKWAEILRGEHDYLMRPRSDSVKPKKSMTELLIEKLKSGEVKV